MTEPNAADGSKSSTDKPVSDSSSELLARLVGRMLGGRYLIKKLIGEGGMGAVFEGEHTEIGKRVAIKVLHGMLSNHAEVILRFKQEARAASAIESEHIVHVFDVGHDPACGVFMVMELLRGQDLATILEKEGPLRPEFACGLVMQAAHALEKAHAAGIVHRDLKPANLFLVQRDDGSALVKVLDFGIAKVLREDSATASHGLTRHGAAIGTPQYMSPEQAQGLTTIDHRTDIYSLGAVLFEAIAGRSPYALLPTYEQTILQILTKPVPELSDALPVSPELSDLVYSMMLPDPEARLAEMREVRRRIVDLFPELEGARLIVESFPPRARKPEGTELGVGAPLAIVSSTPRRGIPVAGTPVRKEPRAMTSAAVSYALSADGSPLSDDIPGVPKKGGGAGLVFLGFAVLGIVGATAGVFYARSERRSVPAATAEYPARKSETTSPSSVSDVARSGAPKETLPISGDPTPTPSSSASARSAEPTRSKSSVLTKKPDTERYSTGDKGTKPERPTPEPVHTKDQVGGVGVAEEF